jgi:hypothetical protein
VSIHVQAFEADESADQYELHCSQQFPAKEIVWFPVIGRIEILVIRDVTKMVVVSSSSKVLDGIVIGDGVIIGALDKAETGVGSSRCVLLDGMIDRGVSPIAAPAERVIPIPAAMKSPRLLDSLSTLCAECCSTELSTDGSKAEDADEAVGETDEAVELTQGTLVCCA